MPRKRRHINARHDEWIVVHRPKREDGSGCLGIIVIAIVIFVLLRGCA